MLAWRYQNDDYAGRPPLMTSALVVGSGPNGLAAAITLAQKGVAVTIGGGLRSDELTLPGLLHDHRAAK